MEGWVYFIEAVGLNLIKIGFTAGSPDARLNSLLAGSPVPLVRLAVLRSDRILEPTLHRRFARLRARRDGEWFRDDPELRDVIRDAQPWPSRGILPYDPDGPGFEPAPEGQGDGPDRDLDPAGDGGQASRNPPDSGLIVPDDLKMIGFRASAAYRRKLAEVRRLVAKGGVRAEAVDTDPKLVEHLATAAAFTLYDVRLPPPTGKKHGGARPGAGRPAKAGPTE
jgi:hypothetical protein